MENQEKYYDFVTFFKIIHLILLRSTLFAFFLLLFAYNFIMSNRPNQKLPHAFSRNSDEIDQNEESLEQQNHFELQNKIYQLNSVISNLELKNNKLKINEAHLEQALRQIRQKYTYMERMLAEKEEKDDKNAALSDLRRRCQQLAEENQSLKRQMHGIFEKNRITPNFNSPEYAGEIDILGSFLEKDIINKLEMQFKEEKQSLYDNLNRQNQDLQKDNERLKEQNLRAEQQRKQMFKLMIKQTEEHNNVLQFKDKIIEDMKNQQVTLAFQLEEYKKFNSLANDQKSSQQIKVITSQLQEKQNKIASLQEQVYLLQMENNRAKSQKGKIQQDYNHALKENKQHLQKKKLMEDQRYKLQNQLSEFRTSSFSDKIQFKKQLNAVKMESEDEKSKLRSTYEDKLQQTKRLRDLLISLNDQNQQLREQNVQLTKKIDKVTQQCSLLVMQRTKYLKESSKWEEFADESVRNTPQKGNMDKNVENLKQEAIKMNDELAKKNQIIKQFELKISIIEEEIDSKDKVLEILKIEKEQFHFKEKEQANKIIDLDNRKLERQKVIQNLQSQIRTLKDDNKQLELANEELKQKLKTLKQINSDIDSLKRHLKLEKQYYEEMRKEEQSLRKQHKKPADLYPKSSNPFTSSNNSHRQQELEELNRQIEQLSSKNQELAIKLNEAEQEIQRKGFDLNVKQEQIKTIKQKLLSPQVNNFQPLIQASKKTQFNAIFLENKILEMEKQIKSIKAIKEKEFQQYKKIYRKQIQQKYLNQMKKSGAYIHELEKNANLLNNKLSHQTQNIKELLSKMGQLQKENYNIKYQYSETLEELNDVLQKYRFLEQKQKEFQQNYTLFEKITEQNTSLKRGLDKLKRDNEQKSLQISNANDQIKRLNDILMRKEFQIKNTLRKANKSPNSSFACSNRHSQQRQSFTQQYPESQHSVDSVQLRSWIKKSPNFSRI